MAGCPDYYLNISLILSRVMSDIGVNETCVLKRRRANLLAENVLTLAHLLLHENVTRYIFGSQTEGTTTFGLNSDIDSLFSINFVTIIQDWKDWKSGETNLLMIRDERLYPGHCKLQMLYNDVPLPVREKDCPDNGLYGVDCDDKVIYKSHNFEIVLPESNRHGPATTKTFGDVDYDAVLAYPCLTWPLYYRQWSPTCKRRDWPTPEMIRHMKSTGCFLVKSAHRLDDLDDRDETWRISTSLAERCLMFSLNLTQIRCNVLLKMIVKTFVEPYLPDTIFSYMCKTLLFHCIENTRKEFWKEHNLLQCVHQVLLYMKAAVLDENCPNYFNKATNLFLFKLSGRKRNVLLSILRHLINVRGRYLLSIKFDNINARLRTFLSGINNIVSHEEDFNMKSKLCVGAIAFCLVSVSAFQLVIIQSGYSMESFNSLYHIENFIEQGELQKQAARLILPCLLSDLATIDVSKSQFQKTPINPLTIKLFDLSLNSDVTSSRLRFASYLYCTGQLERTLSVLQDVEERMTDSVIMICGCHRVNFNSRYLERVCSQKYPTTDSLAMCVMFSRAGSQCCPRELQYEMFRSTDEERKNRMKVTDNWMDLAVMDALPYLYFLTYVTCRCLGQHDQQYTALNRLSDCVRNNEYLPHRETAYNVLGKCMEYEGWLEDAFECYRASLRYRPDNNAVRWHIMRLMLRWTRERL